jgi:peptidoglycan hydrolase-like protein with peptidoglycan-binding domain
MSETHPVLVGPTTPPPASGEAQHATPTDEASTGEPPRRRRPGRWTIGLTLTGLAVAGAVAWFVFGGDGTDAAEAPAPVTVRTATAEQRDLVDSSTIEGTLGYARDIAISAPVAGTVTELIGDGEPVERNTVVAEIDAVPMVAFFGDKPMYRNVGQGDEGEDVAAIEQNLAVLGYHATTDSDGDLVDTGFVVDGVFDAATRDAVERWQADLGVAETGEVTLGSVVMVPGPSSVASTWTVVGGLVTPGVPIATFNVESAGTTFHAAHAGEIELIATNGQIASGDVVYLVEDVPVVGIVTDERFDRDLWWGSEGSDVEVLETFLVGAGYDAGGDLVVDEVYDGSTAEAVEDWKDDLSDDFDDVVVEATVRAGDLIAVPPGTTVEEIAALPDPAPSGSTLFSYSLGDTGRVVRTSIDVSDQITMPVGTVLDIEFPDGTIVAGTVAHVSSATTSDPMDPTAEPQLEVEIELDSVPDDVADLTELTVDILIVDRLAAGATVVPASALVATDDGGFAVEVLSGTTTRFVAVTPGLFADGFVAVDGIAVGTTVVVP